MSDFHRFAIIDNIRNSLDVTLEPAEPVSKADVWHHIQKATQMLGYGEPFDREQREINQLLVDMRASKTQCFSAWAYYYDCKMIEAKRTF